MAASSKSSQTAKNVVIALLALWSIISLIVIVVWATSPDLKPSAQCRAELQDLTEKLEGSRVVWGKHKEALEEKVLEEREKVDLQKTEILLLHGRLNATNASLEECQQENVILKGNISALQDTIEQLRHTQRNLTVELRLREDDIETLQQNLTLAFHQTQSCFSLNAAAESQKSAAESQTKACKTELEYQKKQLQKCRSDSAVAKQTPPPQQKQPQQDKDDNSAASPLTGIPVLTLLVCSALHLIT
ncbi:uncharacterized protein si:ch211-1a19.3 [Anabas testudineus]|nr:uncharacterized protein si:ch211-1a19.3 [Anabas testudineus]